MLVYNSLSFSSSPGILHHEFPETFSHPVRLMKRQWRTGARDDRRMDSWNVGLMSLAVRSTSLRDSPLEAIRELG